LVNQEDIPRVPSSFLATPPEDSLLSQARVALLPVPYDGTTTFKSGAREGPRAIIEASAHLEDYDPELDADPSLIGIHTAPFLEPTPGAHGRMLERVRRAVSELSEEDRLVGLLGGEHSIAVGGVKALLGRYPNLSVLFLDAHADLRDEYMGTTQGKASVARRILDLCPLVQVGVRSLSLEERDFIRENDVPCFMATGDALDAYTIGEIVSRLSPRVYVSLDLDVLDPSLMHAVGTPEPGGLMWRELLALLRRVCEERQVVGFDVSELCPGEGPSSCAYTTAALVYKLIGYATLPYHRGETGRQ
jgi:agmatinase